MKLPAENGKMQQAGRNYKKAVLLVPFWRMAGHVGNNRVDRFKRWLIKDGYELIIVCAGAQEAVRTEVWGQEITIVDRLGLYPEAILGQATAVSTRKPSKLRRTLAYWAFNPDPGVVWAKAAASHSKVIEAMRGAQFILSSGSPESVHVGAWMLSRKTGVPHIMDMRDGWLDEPLKPLLLTSKLRRWIEGRLESRIATDAKVIQVTSDVWKNLFDARYPHLAHKVHVLTNGYPVKMPTAMLKKSKGIDDELVLIHAGRFMGSRLSHSPELLMEPLFKNLELIPGKGVIRFYGDMSSEEVARIQSYQHRLAAINWRIEFLGVVPRFEMLEAMQQADGLLLLSASHAALPSKLFEYLATGLKIGFVAIRGSATHTALCDLPQCIDLSNGTKNIGFLEPVETEIPESYSENSLERKFMQLLRGLS